MSRLNQLSTRPPENSVAVSHHARRQKVSRAPMVNPYDKFSQPDFDAWIGDMTSALRHALGYEQDESLLLEKSCNINDAVNGVSPKYRQLDLSDQDEVPDDSLAQIKARRNKGKARDPREGPGLGRDRTQPIELLSSDEEEAQEVEDLTFSLEDDDTDLYDQDEGVDYDHLRPHEVDYYSETYPNVTQESLAMTFDVGSVPFEVGLEEQDDSDDIQIIEPEVLPDTMEDILQLDAGSKSPTADVEIQVPEFYEDFDDIYKTGSEDEGRIQPAEFFALSGSQTWDFEDAVFETEVTHEMISQVIDVEVDPDSSDLAEVSHNGEYNALAEAHEDTLPSSLSPQWHENNNVAFDDIVLQLKMEERPAGAWKHEVFSVDGTNSSGSASPNGFQNVFDDHLERQTPEFMPQNLPVMHSPSCPFPGQPQIPMPVMADANVPDPTESPRLQGHHIFNIPATPDIVVTSLQVPQIAEELPGPPSLPLDPLLHPLNPVTDGLFTPAEFSTVTTPAEDSAVVMLPSEWQEADITGSPTTAPIDLYASPELTNDAAPPPEEGAGDIHADTEIAPSGPSESDEFIVPVHMPVLMADPYPYCLSTPIISLTDDESLEEVDVDTSIDSDSMVEKEHERVEAQATPLAADIEHAIPSQTALTELEGAALGTADPQAIGTSTQNLPQNVIIEDPDISPILDEDIPVVMELQRSVEATTTIEDSPGILAESSVEDSKEQIATAGQPLEAGLDVDLRVVQQHTDGNGWAPDKDTEGSGSAIVADLPHFEEQVKQDSISQTAEVSPASQPSKRKRESSSDPDASPVKVKGKSSARRKGKRRGKETETDIAEQSVHDTIHVRSRPSLRDFGTSENSAPRVASNPINNASEFSNIDVTKPIEPRPQLQAPSLFHAHGRNKRQKTLVQPIASVKQTRDSGDQPAIQHASAPEKPPLQSAPLRDPSPPLEPVLPATAEVVASEVLQAPQASALQSSGPSKPTTVVPPVVDLPTPKSAASILQSSSVTPTVESSKSVHSIPATTVEPPPALAPQSSPARLPPTPIPTTPVRSTRSQCKYHKITLPKGENGPRVCFLVPGCSLTNQELMKEEEIEDGGEATYEDSLRIIRDIEYLDFDQYLMGPLRQLVGLDILREGEVFYLPLPGDEVQTKHWTRKSIAKGSEYAGFAGSPGYLYSGSARSPSTRPPLSNAGSISALSAMVATENGSDTDNQEGSTTPGDGISLSKGRRKTKTRKGKVQDNTFQPSEHDEESPDESTQQKRRKSTTGGIKRTRTHDGATGNDGPRKSKRLRLRLTDPSLYQTD